MSFTVIVFEAEGTPVYSDDQPTGTIKRYEQTVEALDLPALMAAVNRKARKPRERKPKAEA